MIFFTATALQAAHLSSMQKATENMANIIAILTIATAIAVDSLVFLFSSLDFAQNASCFMVLCSFCYGPLTGLTLKRPPKVKWL